MTIWFEPIDATEGVTSRWIVKGMKVVDGWLREVVLGEINL